MAHEFPESRQPCIWMEAGVIDYKICDKEFDCEHCELDRALTEAAAANLAKWKGRPKPVPEHREVLPWEEKMRQRFGDQQKCRLMMTSLCHECSFDELLEEQFDFFLAPERPRVQEVMGIMVPVSSFLHRGHTWVALENAGRVRLGMDDFCQRVLGPPEEVSLPEVGEKVFADQTALMLSRQGKTAPVLAPLTGIIDAVNPKIRDNPRLIHDDPYGEGWLFLVSPTHLKPDLEKMLFGQCNVAWIEHEAQRLLGMLESVAGVTLPSGGAILDDVYGAYPQLGWDRLVHEFLHST
jgi:glycine cleavage system H lipoate-binding protein